MSETRAILSVLDSETDELQQKICTVFGATSLEECRYTYALLGASERAGIDEAVQRVTANAGAAFHERVRAAAAELEANGPHDPESVLADLYSGFAATSVTQSYVIRRRWFSIGRGYFVDDENGTRKYLIGGRIGFARRFSIRDLSRNVLYSAREKLLVLDPTFIIKRDGVEAAVVRRTTTGNALEDRFEIKLQSGELLHAAGKVWHEPGVEIRQGTAYVGRVLREQLVLRERYFVSVRPSSDQALLLAIAMSIAEIDPTRGQT